MNQNTFKIISKFNQHILLAYSKNDTVEENNKEDNNKVNEEEYNNYINECKKASLYDTKKTAQYGEQLLTLSTCEYSQEDGRFVVVAKKTKKLN